MEFVEVDLVVLFGLIMMVMWGIWIVVGNVVFEFMDL